MQQTGTAYWMVSFVWAANSLVQAAEPRQWPVELKLGRFEIHSDFDITSASPLSPELAQLSNDVCSVLELGSCDKPVHVVLFESQHEYQRYMRNYFPLLPERRALFIQDRGPGMLFAHWHAELASDLRHEITHALLNDSSHPLPLWLDEGLAEYFEVERTRRFDGCEYLAAVNQRCVQGLVPSLKKLEEINDLPQFNQTHYRDSWAWVHFLIHRSSTTRKLLVKYLANSRIGVEQLPLSRQLSQYSHDIHVDFQRHFQLLKAD